MLNLIVLLRVKIRMFFLKNKKSVFINYFFKFFPETRSSLFFCSALFIALSVSLLLYPGTFSNDSFVQLEQAKNHSYSTWHPVIMALVMHYLLPIFGIGGLFIVHQFIYWFSIALIIDALFKRRLVYLFVGFFSPVFLLTVEIWKDTGMLVCCMLALACVLQFNRKKNISYLVIATIAILYASCVRTNALFVTAFLFAGTLLILFNKKSSLIKKGIIFSSVFFIICISALFINNVIIKTYKAKEDNPLPGLFLWDIAGISHFSGKHFNLPDYIQIYDSKKSSKWSNNYQPFTNSICWGNGFSCNLNDKKKSFVLTKDWFNTVKEEPIAYLQHRMTYIRYLFNIQKSVYYPYQGYSQNIDKGGNFLPHKLGIIFFKINEKLGNFIQKVYLYHSFSWIIVIFLTLLLEIRRLFKRIKIAFEDKIAIVLCISGLSNAFSLAIIGPAADYRYMIWSVFSGLMSIFLLLSSSSMVIETKNKLRQIVA